MSIIPRILGRAFLLLLTLLLAAPLAAQDRASILRDLVVESGETAGEVMCYFCNVVVRGTVNDEALAFWGGVEVHGRVQGDVVVLGGGIRVLPGGRIQEDAVAIAGPVVVDRGGVVVGETTAKPWGHFPGQRQIFWRGALAWLATVVVAAFLALCAIGARRVYHQAEYLREHPWKCVLTGLVLTSAVMGLYALTDYFEKWDYDGVWAVAVTVLWFGLVIAGLAGTCCRILRRLPITNILLLTILGAFATTALTLIPVLGLLVCCWVTFAAMGVVAFTRFRAAD